MFSPLDPGLVAQYTKQIQDEFTWLGLESSDVGRRSFPPKVPLSSTAKNRYKGFVALESTRVRLSNPGSDGDDYINANFISGEVPNSESWYISCQAPLEATFGDFWKMIWEQRSGVIVMLTNLVENNKVKAERYWPATLGEESFYGNFAVIFHKEFPVGDRPLVIRSFRLRAVQSPDEKPREVVQIQLLDWPDFGVPDTTKHVRELCIMLSELKKRSELKGTTGPAVLHCSAGVGRAGTFVALHIANERFMQGLVPLDLMSTVRKLRTQRRGMVQTISQYQFLYQCTKEALMHRLGLTQEEAMRLLLAPSSPSLSLNGFSTGPQLSLPSQNSAGPIPAFSTATIVSTTHGAVPSLTMSSRRLAASMPNIAQPDVIAAALLSPKGNKSTNTHSAATPSATASSATNVVGPVTAAPNKSPSRGEKEVDRGGLQQSFRRIAPLAQPISPSILSPTSHNHFCGSTLTTSASPASSSAATSPPRTARGPTLGAGGSSINVSVRNQSSPPISASNSSDGMTSLDSSLKRIALRTADVLSCSPPDEYSTSPHQRQKNEIPLNGENSSSSESSSSCSKDSGSNSQDTSCTAAADTSSAPAVQMSVLPGWSSNANSPLRNNHTSTGTPALAVSANLRNQTSHSTRGSSKAPSALDMTASMKSMLPCSFLSSASSSPPSSPLSSATSSFSTASSSTPSPPAQCPTPLATPPLTRQHSSGRGFTT